jgi:hypothetical protein
VRALQARTWGSSSYFHQTDAARYVTTRQISRQRYVYDISASGRRATDGASRYLILSFKPKMVKVAENRVIDLDVFPGVPKGDKLAEQTK